MIEHTVIDWISLLIGMVCLLALSYTMLLRGNDYRRKYALVTWVSTLRMIGFILTGFAPYGVAAWWLMTGLWPSIFITMLLVGVSLISLTSPELKYGGTKT